MGAIECVIGTTSTTAIKESEFRPQLVKPKPKLLSVSGFPEDHILLAQLIDTDLWRLAAADTSAEARVQLSGLNPLVVICESMLPDGTWRDVLKSIEALSRPPWLVVTSGNADENLWCEVLSLGGYDVLAKPFSREEVRNVLVSALSCGRNRPRRSGLAGAA